MATSARTSTGTTGVEKEHLSVDVDTHRLWCSVLTILRAQVPEPSFRTWLEGTHLHALAGMPAPEPGTPRVTRVSQISGIPAISGASGASGVSGIVVATVSVPSTFASEWLQCRYGALIAVALEKCLGRRATINFKVEPVRSGRALRALDGLGAHQEERHQPVAVGQSAPLYDGPSSPASSTASSPASRHSSSSKTAAASNSGDLACAVTVCPNGALDAKGAHATGTTPRWLPGTASTGDKRSRPPALALARLVPHQDDGQLSIERALLVPTAPALNPRYTFDRLLVGRGNQLAVSVARRVAEAPGSAYNPLFIYGLRWVGKTHLLEAIGHDAHTRTRARVLFASALQFRDPDFRSRLASTISLADRDTGSDYELLLVDDLHQIAGLSGRVAQRSLELVVERMLAAGKGVVMTATRPPDAMLALQDTLRFRLRGGMVVEIDLPDSDLRTRMVQRLADESGMQLAQGALELLVSAGQSTAEVHATWERASAHRLQAAVGAVPGYVKSRDHNGQKAQSECRRHIEDYDETDTGVRTLVATVTPRPAALPTRNLITRTVVTAEDVQVALDSRQCSECHACVRPETIIDQVSAYFDLEPNELSSSSRERRVILPRHIAMYLMREETDATYEWIAHRFARQDHTTSMYACTRVEELIETDPEIRQVVLELRQMVHGEQGYPYPGASSQITSSASAISACIAPAVRAPHV